MQGVLKVNGLDAFTNYGWVVTKGTYQDLDRLAKPKDNGLSMSFANSHGDDDYAGAVFLEAQNLTISFNLKASSEVDYYSKLAATKALLYAPGEKNFDFLKLGLSGIRFKLIYRDCSGFKRLTNVKSTSNVVAMFTLLLKNNYPNENFLL